MSLSKVVVGGITAAGSVVGGLLGYFIAKKVYGKSVIKSTGTDNRVHKATSEFASELDRYILDNSLNEPDVLAKLRKYTFENVARSMMLCDPVEAQLIRVLLKMINARKCIEVGTYTGYNALNMALSVPSDGIVYALDIDENYVSHGRPFFEEANVAKKIDIRIGQGSDSLEALIQEGHAGTIDFVFIDADKVNYDLYYEKALLLLRCGGMIVLDNMVQGGRVVNVEEQHGDRRSAVEAIHNLNQKLKEDKRVMLSLLKIADGVTLCIKL